MCLGLTRITISFFFIQEYNKIGNDCHYHRNTFFPKEIESFRITIVVTQDIYGAFIGLDIKLVDNSAEHLA